MLLGAIADDFTGASDLANTLARGGMKTRQFIGVPDDAAAAECEAGVVALKTRSVAADSAVEQSLAALAWLIEQGCSQILFKYCSTFDSTAAGNIGPVAEALMKALQVPVAIVCPVFPALRRTLYLGHLFVGDRLLSESGMENHPLNPMTDPNIRRFLRLQTTADVGLVPYPTVREGSAAIQDAISREAAKGNALVVVDAVADADLVSIGAAVADHRLVTGGSGIALGLPANFAAAGLLSGSPDVLPAVSGPGCVLSGSCSTMSLAQVNRYLETHPGLEAEPCALLDGRMNVKRAADWVRERWDSEPIVYSTAEPAAVAAAQERYGRENVAETIERFFGKLAVELADRGARRLVVGGGETSGAVVMALGLRSFAIGEEIDPGVPALGATRNGPLAMALKSGNFGRPDFFATALGALGHK